MTESEIVALAKEAGVPFVSTSKTAADAQIRFATLLMAQQKAEPVVGELYVRTIFSHYKWINGEPRAVYVYGVDAKGLPAPYPTEAEALAFIESCRPKQEQQAEPGNGKYCAYCKVMGHDTKECWSTQPVPAHEHQIDLSQCRPKQETADKCEKCNCFMVEHSADGTCPETNSATPYPDNTGQSDELPSFEDPRVQIAYQLLVDNESPPNSEEHWEGYTARRIVSALFDTSPRQSEQSDEAALKMADAAFVQKYGLRVHDEFAAREPIKPIQRFRDGFIAGCQSSRRDVGAAGLNQVARTCAWRLDEPDSGGWATGCNGMFMLNEGTPMENDMTYCPYCGRKIDAAIAAGKEGA